MSIKGLYIIFATVPRVRSSNNIRFAMEINQNKNRLGVIQLLADSSNIPYTTTAQLS